MAKLLRLLEQDCTLTHEQLASMTDMTVADVKAAIQRYEADKTILGYQAGRPLYSGPHGGGLRPQPGGGHRPH